MSGRVILSPESPVRSFLTTGIGSTLFFGFGLSGFGLLDEIGFGRGLVVSLVYLVVHLVTFPLVLDHLRESRVARMLLTILAGLSVVPLADFYPGVTVPSSNLAAGLLFALVGGEGGRVLRDYVWPTGAREGSRTTDVLVVGAGEAGEMLLRELRHQPGLNREVLGFLDDDPDKQGTTVEGVPVLGTTDDLVEICRDYDVAEVIIAMPSVDGEVIRSVVAQRSAIQARMRIVPGIREIIEGDFRWSQIRPVRPEDLLGRETVDVDDGRIRDFLRGRTVLVTGAAGSIGSYLVQEILEYPVDEVIGLDFNESDLYELEVSELNTSQRSRFTPALGDVRDADNCSKVMEKHRPDLVLHAAALKHVPMVERHPLEGLRTNVQGCVNVFEAAGKQNVEHCLLISTDKAVDPKNVMGYTKRMGERLVGTYQSQSNEGGTRYAAVRFGNVLGSRGSVVPLFKRQIEEGGPVTVTDPEMVRYFMTPGEAVKLVLTAASFEDRGNTYVLDIGDPISIMDLAHQLIALMGYEPETDIPIEIVGLREGETIEENLFADAESPRETDHPKIRRIPPEGLNDDTFESFRAFFRNPPEDPDELVRRLEEYVTGS